MVRFFFSLIFYFLYLKTLHADAYEIIVLSIHEQMSIETKKEYKFSVSEAIGNWQDNLGNYGKAKILFSVESKKNSNVELKGLIELLDNESQNIWLTAIRRSTEEVAGVGKMKIIETTKKYSHLLNKDCTYAINYFDDRSYMKVKCF